MKIYFDDPEYDGQFLRALDHAPLGAQIGEAWTIAAQIRVGDAASWYNAWSSYADRCVRSRRQIPRCRASGQRPQRVPARIELLSHRCTFSCLRCPLIRA